MTDVVDTLFDEYAARWARGERPDTAEYLERAGAARGDLATMIDRYLSVAPAPEPEEALVRFAELLEAGDPPLLAARVARGLRRDEVVKRVMEAFALPADTEPKVSAYWHQLESGTRRPGQVAPELWREVVRTLGSLAEAARGWQPRGLGDLAFRRVADVSRAMDEPSAPVAPAAAATPLEEDEVDRLFGYGP